MMRFPSKISTDLLKTSCFGRRSIFRSRSNTRPYNRSDSSTHSKATQCPKHRSSCQTHTSSSSYSYVHGMLDMPENIKGMPLWDKHGMPALLSEYPVMEKSSQHIVYTNIESQDNE